MKLLSFCIAFLAHFKLATSQGCGESNNAACGGVQPCFDTASPPTATCFQSCQTDDDCGDAEACRTMGTCGDTSTVTVCQYGCEACEDDGSQFVCLCFSDCPIAGAQYPSCSTVKRQQCIGTEYSHPSFADDTDTSTTSEIGALNFTLPCISGHSEVNVLDKGYTYLKDLEKGDKVLVSSDSDDSSLDEYQEVYGFGHRDVYAVATFLQFATAGNQGESSLELTGEHLVMKRNSLTGDSSPVRADSVEVGDFLIGKQGIAEKVTQVSTVTRPGLYSPVTKDGKMLVNGVQVPAYTAAQDRHPENFVVGNWETISHYLMSHAAISPLRVMCLAGGLTHFCEQHNAKGQLLYANRGESLISWITTGVQIIILPPGFLALLNLYFMEQLFGGFSMMYVFPLACLLVAGIVSVSHVQKKKFGAKI